MAFSGGLAGIFGRNTRTPKDVRLFVVGDIHGKSDLLKDIHEQIRGAVPDAHKDRKHNIIIYLGDYIDRGPNSKQVIDILLEPWPKGWRQVFIKGNHEEILLDFVNGECSFERWLKFGAKDTLLSYGVSEQLIDDYSAETELRLRAAVFEKLPESHLNFFKKLELIAIYGDYGFVHAGVHPANPLEAQDPHDLMWIRGRFLNSKKKFGKMIVHGHTPVQEVDIHKNRINIDTGAYLTGRLTCMSLEDTQRKFLITKE